MGDDVRRVIYGTIIGFFLVVLSWLAIVYVSACGLTLTCVQASPLVIRTPMPTLNPEHALQPIVKENAAQFNKCEVAAQDLIGAWVTAGSPEKDPFPFTDVHGNPCQATFPDDVQHLFVENELWFTGSIGCVSCHNPDKPDHNGGLDLTSYQGIQAGAKGASIVGDGKWESSALHAVLVEQGFVPAGHSKDVPPLAPVYIYAGQRAASTAVTATATP